MRLAEKLRNLRVQAGEQRGIGRALTKAEVTRLMREELGDERALSAPYLSQLESGARSHMTEHTRATLAAFYRVHPGYLVSDPEGDDAQRSAAALPDGVADGPAGGIHRKRMGGAGEALLAGLLTKIRRQPDPGMTARAIDALLDLPPERLQALALATAGIGQDGER